MTIQKMLTRNTFFAALFALAIGFGFTACDTADEDDGMASMSVALTDAPANYEEVNIEIKQVLVHRNEDQDLDEDDDADNSEEIEENGWKVIMEDSINVNLLDYQGGATLELGETTLEAGRYQQVRLILGNDNNIVVDGETFALTTPSTQQSGYKLNIDADIEEGESYELIIDFDASQSIVAAGLSGNFILKPVLRTVDLETSGSISGMVMPLEAEPFVYAIMDQDTMGTQVDAEGAFTITGLAEGMYDIWVEPTNEIYGDSLIEGVQVDAEEDFEFEETIELEVSSN